MTKPPSTASKPTPEEQLLALKRAFAVPDTDWQKITELATSLSPKDALETIREIVLCRQLLLWPPLPRGVSELGLAEKQRAGRIAKASEALLNDVNLASGLASVFEHPESGNAEEWILFLYYLEKLCDRAKNISAPIKPPPHNVDGKRDLVWKRLIALFERTTGKKARVSNSAIEARAFGKIVDFIQAFSRSVPGSSVPTADEIRGVERKSRDERRVASKV